MNPDNQVPAVILVPLDDERFDTYREALFNRIDAPDIYEELTESHITIHPGFKTTQSGIETLKTYFEGIDVNIDAEASAIYAYPSPDDPAVIAVAVTADLHRVRDDIQYILNGYDHDIINEPSPTHITLLRRRDINPDDVPVEVVERVRAALDEMSLPSAIQLGDPRIEWYNPPYRLSSE